MDSVLLCTFSHQGDVGLSVDYIFQNYEVERNSIYLFNNDENRTEVFLTYNAIGVEHMIENTISIHRKKETNTLYTINALNEIIIRANNGILDKTFILEWDRYRNSLLLTNAQGVRIIPLNLIKVVHQ